MTTLFWLVGLVLLAGGALWLAIWNNGPAVVDALDRVAGPDRDVALVETARYGDDPAQKVRVYRQGGSSAPKPVFVFVHGGGWAHGDPDDYGFIARNIAPEGYVVVLAGYRLLDGGRYPAMLEDTAQALRWVRDNAARLGGDPARIVIGGHSAGAYNAVALALDTRWLARAGLAPDTIRGVVGLSGPYDFYPFETERSKFSFGTVNAGPDSQPINHARAGAPPMLFVHGEDDVTVRIRNSRNLAAALRAKGNDVATLYLPGADHNAPLLRLTWPWRRDPQVFTAVRDFLARTTRVPAEVSVPVQPTSP